MAKKKISSAPNTLSVGGYSPTLYIDFDDLKEIEGVALGDTVTIVVKGKVKSLEQRSYEGESPRASLCLKEFEAEIASNPNIFEELADEDD